MWRIPEDTAKARSMKSECKNTQGHLKPKQFFLAINREHIGISMELVLTCKTSWCTANMAEEYESSSLSLRTVVLYTTILMEDVLDCDDGDDDDDYDNNGLDDDDYDNDDGEM